MSKRLLSIDPNAYTSKDVEEWLGLIGFEKYAREFVSNEVDGAALFELEDNDLVSLGIKRLGERKQLIRKIRALQRQTTSAWDQNVADSNSSSSSSQTTGSSRTSEGAKAATAKDSKIKLKVKYDGEVSIVKIKRNEKLSSVLRRVRKAVGIDVTLSYKDGGDDIKIKDRRAWKAFVADCAGKDAVKVTAHGAGGSDAPQSRVKLSAAVRGIYDGMGDACVVLDDRGTILLFNAAATKLFQWSAKEAVGQNIKIIMSQRDADSHDFYMQRYMRAPEHSKIVGKGSRLVIAIAKDRSDVPVDLSVSAHKDDDGNTYLVGLLRSAAKVTDDEDPAAKYEVLNGLLTPAFVIDHEAEIIFVNNVVEEQLGYTALDLLGENISLIVPSPHKERHDTYVNNYLQTGEAKVIGTKRKLSVLHRSGKELPCELTVTQMGRGDARTFTGIVELVEEKLEGVEFVAKLDKKLAKLMIAACCIDGQGVIRAANGKMLKLFGYGAASEVVGNKVNMLMPENVSVKHDGYLKSYLSNPGRDSVVVGKGRQVTAQAKDGKLFPVYLAVKYNTDTDGHQFLTATLQEK